VPATTPQALQRSGNGHQAGPSNPLPQLGQMKRPASKWPYIPASPHAVIAKFEKNAVSKYQPSGLASNHSGTTARKAPHLSLKASLRSAHAR